MRFVAVLLTWALATLPAAAAELRDLRLWDSPDSTRVVFDLSDAAEHKVFTLANPDRIVIDIAGLDPKSQDVIARATGKGLVHKVRAGPRDNGLRVVLDVGGAVTPKSFVLAPNEEYGHRLVLDLYGPPAAAAPHAEALAGPVLPATAGPATPAIAVVPPSAPAPVRSLQDKPIVVAIDAGHGGEDPGARGRSGLLEKDVALSVARKLAKLINQEPNMRAVLTRDGDYYLGLRERVGIARKHQADLFVSVHANAFRKRDMRGTAVYVVSHKGASNEHARWLAHKENAADLVGGVELQDKDHELASVLIDLSQSATMEASFDVGSRILQSMGRINVLQKPEVQQAGFAVLKAPDIPSVLVETAFITNDREEKLLRDREYHDKLARSILEGVRGYFASYRPQQQVVEAGPEWTDAPPMAEAAAAEAVEISYTQGVSQ